jgi:hypothetical protein
MNLKEILDACQALDITPDELTTLLVFKEKQANLTRKFRSMLERRYSEEHLSEIALYIRHKGLINDKNELTLKALEFFKQGANFDEFINQYRQLFADTGKVGAMGSKAGCDKKMRKFVAAHPEWSYEFILQAAQAYIDSVRELKYLQQADYVIEKNNGSRLETYCEELQSGLLNGSNNDIFTIKT